jgi:hypothetical protein
MHMSDDKARMTALVTCAKRRAYAEESFYYPTTTDK